MIHSCPMSLLARSPPVFHSGFIANTIQLYCVLPSHRTKSKKRKTLWKKCLKNVIHCIVCWHLKTSVTQVEVKLSKKMNVCQCSLSAVPVTSLPISSPLSLLTFPFYSHSKIVTKLLFVLTSAGLVSVFAFDLTVSNSVMSFRRHIHWPWSARLT